MAPRKLLLFEWVCLLLVLGKALGNHQNENDYECEEILDQASRFAPSNTIVTRCCSGKGLRYECINGYQLVSGNKERHCRYGNITGTEPRCEFPKMTTCGNPGPVMYGYFIGSNFNISSRVKYKCYNGFVMHGHSHRTCLENGLWSEPPTCEFDDKSALDIETATDVISNNLLQSLYETKCSGPGPSCQSTSSSRRRRALDANHAGGLDLVFMFDGSSSIKKDGFVMGLRFAQELVRILDATGRRGGVKVAAMTFAASMKINFPFTFSSDRTLRKIRVIKKPGGCGSNLGRSMFLLRKRITPAARRESKRALFIVSNGRLILGTSHKRAARLLKTENRFEVFVIGIGKNPNVEELSTLVSEPVKDHIIAIKVFSDVFGSVRKALAPGRDSKCGISNTKPKSRTIRGNKAASGAWPWQIGIYWDKARSPICGGALIGDQWVLTAAHCFYSSARKAITWPPWRYTVVAGDHQETRKQRENSKQMAPVAKIYVNKNFRYHTNQNDIALVKLQYKLKIGKHVRAVCLPSNIRGKKTSDSGKHGFVTEWDRPDVNVDGSRSKTKRRNRSRVLVHTALVISPPQRCFNMTSKPFNSTLMFCAMDRKSFKQNCRGDGGSAFVSEKYDQSTRDYRWSIDGLVGWDEKCGTDKHHRFFTRVNPYVHWIRKVTREHGRF